MKYLLKASDGHRIVSIGENDFLVDTGSPTSFARAGTLRFGGRVANVPQSAMGMMDSAQLSAFVGATVDGLIGMDVLSRHLIVFNGGELFVDECPIPESEFTRLEREDFMGIPVVALRVAGRIVNVFVDTGAKISYLSNEMLKTFPIEETLQDFYPGLGRFRVEISTLPVELADFSFTVRFGRLPAILQRTLVTGGVHGILGQDLWAEFLVRLDVGGSSISIMRRPTATLPSSATSSRDCPSPQNNAANCRKTF